MAQVTLTAVTLMNQSAAGASALLPNGAACDWRNSGAQDRNIMTNMNAADTVTIQGTPDNTNWFTIATLTGAASQYTTVKGPFLAIKATKTGTAGTALVMGLI
jgi:hypothetical protein